MTKKLSDIQWQGRRGEKAFEYWSTELGLLPTNLQPDEGIDYVCQVVGDRTKKTSHAMTANLVAAWVRASEKNDVKVQIGRDDAIHLLGTNVPALVILVDLKTQDSFPRLHVRILDAKFLRELWSFLRGTKKSRTLRADACISDRNEIEKAIQKLLRPGARERLDALKRELKVQHALPGASYKNITTSEHSLSLVDLPDCWAQFDLNATGARSLRDAAVFGRQEFFHARMARMPLRQELSSVFTDLPNPVVIRGLAFSEGAKATLTARGPYGEAKCTFQSRHHDIWLGYCHSTGLTIRVSKAIEDEAGWVHLTEDLIDPLCEVSSIYASDLKPFLKCSRGKAEVVFSDDHSFSVQHFPDLNALGWLCEYLDVLGKEPSLDLSGWKADDVTEEDLQSLRVLSELKKKQSTLDGFGLVVGNFPHETLRHERVEFDIPLCMNFRQTGLVCWLSVSGEYLLDPESKKAVGLRILQTHSARTERMLSTFPTEGIPKFKICPEWPAVRLDLLDQKVHSTDQTDWGVTVRRHFREEHASAQKPESNQ